MSFRVTTFCRRLELSIGERICLLCNSLFVGNLWDPTLSLSIVCMTTLKVKRDGKVYEYTLLERLGSGSYSQVYKCQRSCGPEKEMVV